MLDQHTEHAAPARQITDRHARLLVEARGQELGELGAPIVEDPQRRVARAGELTRRLEHTIQHHPEVELCDEGVPHLGEAADPQLLRGRSHLQPA